MSTVVRPPAPQEDQPRISSPYRGLLPYREEDADYFFGRTAYIELVSANLVASRLTVLYAPSGVGKSSLLLAGVVHQMREMARAAVAQHQPPGYVPVVVRRWSGDPIAEIEAAVADGLRAVLGDAVPSGESDLPGLAGVFDAAATASASKVYAVFDQFEELLLYHGGDWEDDDGPARELARLMRADEIRANFLIAIRQDSLAELDSFKGRVPGLLDKRVRLPHLDRTAGREAIEQPLDRWNRRHKVEEGMSLDPELTEAVLDQVATGAIALDRAGGGGTPKASGSIEAPFLQLVMERIWEEERAAGSDQMRRSTLDRLGGATEIVRTHLDRQMQQLSDEEQDVAAAVFHRLVTPSGAKVALRASDLAAWTGIDRETLERVLGELAQSDWRIVRAIDDPDRPDAPPVYEIYHDVLAEAVLDWRARHDEMRRALALATRAREEARRRWLRRLRLGLFVGGAVAVGLIALLAVLASREADDRSRTAASRELAATARAQLGTDPELSILLAEEALRREQTNEAVGALRAGLAANRSLAILDAGTDPVRDIEVAPDKKRILGFGSDGRLRVWGLADHKLVLDVPASPSALTSASFSRHGRRILTTHSDGMLAVWSADDGRELLSVKSGGRPARSGGWDRTGRRFVVVADGAATVWTASGRRLAVLRAPGGAIVSARWHPRTDRTILTAGKDGVARLWNVRSAKATASLATGVALRDARFNDQGSAVVTISAPGSSRAWVWTLSTGRSRPLHHPPDHPQAPLFDATFDHSGKRVATAGLDHRVRIWSARTGETEAILTGHGSYVTRIAFSPDDTIVATASNDRTARTWNAVTGEQVSVLRGHDDWISGLAFPSAGLVATAGNDGDVRLWRTGETQLAAVATRSFPDISSFSPDGAFVVTSTETGAELYPWRAPGASPRLIPVRGGANTASLSPDGQLLLVGTAHDDRQSGPALVLGVRDGRLSGPPLALGKPRNGAVTAAFSPDGRTILTGHRDGAARLWSTRTHRVIRRLGPVGLPSPRRSLIDADFSVGGRQVATVGADGTARLFDTRTGRQLNAFAAPVGKLTRPLNAVALQPGGHLLATAGEDGLALLWDVRTGRARPLQHDDAVTSVAFSPDGAIVATSSWDRTARLWDARTAQPLGVLAHVPANVTSVAFSPDGRRIVTADGTGRVRVFACGVCGTVDELQRRAREQMRRGLTREEQIAYLGADDG